MALGLANAANEITATRKVFRYSTSSIRGPHNKDENDYYFYCHRFAIKALVGHSSEVLLLKSLWTSVYKRTPAYREAACQHYHVPANQLIFPLFCCVLYNIQRHMTWHRILSLWFGHFTALLITISDWKLLVKITPSLAYGTDTNFLHGFNFIQRNKGIDLGLMMVLMLNSSWFIYET